MLKEAILGLFGRKPEVSPSPVDSLSFVDFETPHTRTGRPRLDVDGRIKLLRQAGLNNRQIADALGVSLSTIQRRMRGL
jgi:hypothetical protein